MAPENPWFLITQNEILEIQAQLRHLEARIPESSSQHIGEIYSILVEVRDRLS
jgi:UDP-N-acetyl-D-mannosaminuronate dehydrogenase